MSTGLNYWWNKAREYKKRIQELERGNRIEFGEMDESDLSEAISRCTNELEAHGFKGLFSIIKDGKDETILCKPKG